MTSTAGKTPRFPQLILDQLSAAQKPLADQVNHDPKVAYPNESLRVVVYRMAETGLTRFPVVERGDERKLVGVIGLRDLLSARTRNLSEERDRERVLRIRLPSLRSTIGS